MVPLVKVCPLQVGTVVVVDSKEVVVSKTAVVVVVSTVLVVVELSAPTIVLAPKRAHVAPNTNSERPLTRGVGENLLIRPC